MDFNSISGKSSMKRKQSNSLLHAFGKPISRASGIPFNSSSHSNTPPTATSSHFSSDAQDLYSPDSASPYTETSSHRHTSSNYNLPLHSTRSVSGSASGGSGSKDAKGAAGGVGQGLVIRRPEDVQKISKARTLSWSYMSQWYQGDIHWFNTVRVSRAAIEASIGQPRVDQRARHMHLLGMSIGTVMDITNANDFLKNLLRILDEWESVAEGNGKGVKNLFRGQRSGKKSLGGGGSDINTSINEAETSLAYFNMPFPPDFFLAHAMTCETISDLYKKFTRMVLPSSNPSQQRPLPTRSYSSPHDNSLSNLIHPSTIIHSAPSDNSASNPLSPASGSTYSFHGESNERHGIMSPGGFDTVGVGSSIPATPESRKSDAFQAYVAGQLPSDRKLVGEGQRLTPGLIDAFMKVDQKLRKIYSNLIREGDTLARKVLDDELALLTASLYSGAPLNFDYGAALSGAGSGMNGVYSTGFVGPAPGGVGNGMSPVPSLVSSRGGGGQWNEEVDSRIRDFGTV